MLFLTARKRDIVMRKVKGDYTMRHLLAVTIVLTLNVLYAGPLLAQQSKADSLLILSKKLEGDAKAEVLNELAMEYSSVNPANSEKYAREALALASTTNNFALQVSCKLNLSNALRYQRKFKEVLDVLNPILEDLNKIDNKNQIADILNNIGVAHYQLNHDTLSLSRLFESLSVREEIDDQKGMSSVLNNIGNYYFSNENYDKALEFYLKCQLLDSTLNNQRDLAHTLFNIARVYQLKKDYNTAISYFKKAIDLSQNLNYPVGKSYINLYLAETYYSKKDLDSALITIDRAQELNQTHQNAAAIKYTYLLKAIILKDLHSHHKAIEFFEKALTLSPEENEEQIDLLINLGNTNLEVSNTTKAISSFSKAQSLASKLNKHKLHSLALLGLANAYKVQGNTQKSNMLLWDYSSLKDSIEAEYQRDITKQQEQRFGAEQMERRIEALQKDSKIQNLTIDKEQSKRQSLLILIGILIPLLTVITIQFILRVKTNKELEQKNSQIEQQNEELNAINEQLEVSRQNLIKVNHTKDKFFSIVAHDLKNPLIALRIYLQQGKNEKNEGTRNENLNKLDQALSTVLEMLNNLLFWALTQDNQIEVNPEEFNLNEVLNHEIEFAKGAANQKGISFTASIPSSITVNADKNMLLFIVRNLLSNALKFTPVNGYVTLKYEDGNEMHILEVSDNGVGISPNELKRIFELEKRVNPNSKSQSKGTGLGLMLIKDFINQMNGTIQISSKENEGTTIRVVFPKKEQSES